MTHSRLNLQALDATGDSEMRDCSKSNVHEVSALNQAGGLPVIDANLFFERNVERRNRAARQVLQACRDQGYFSVSNTGIDRLLIQRVLNQASLLFSLADDDPVKQLINAETTPGGMGWSSIYSEPAYTAGTIAHMESFDCGPYFADIANVYRNGRLRLFRSCWPNIQGFRRAVRSYWDEMQVLGSALYAIFTRALELEDDFFTQRCTAAAPSTLRLINYPENDMPDDRRHVGISEHSDFECFTVIYQTAPGLQLQNTNGGWDSAPVNPGQFIVMIGDMLERWTNGHLTATRHRVANTPWARQSLVMFFAADAQCIVEPLPGFISRNRPPRYSGVTQQEHIDINVQQGIANRMMMDV